MKNLWWQTFGNGNYHIVLLHGWGSNALVWNNVVRKLTSYFTLHLVDLPGFGRSKGFGVISLHEITELILQQAPDKAVWLGWSFGGLIASFAALTYPNRVNKLITVAFSPCFSEQNNWPGIKSVTLTKFQCQLKKNFSHTIKRFIILQTMKTNTAKQDAQILKEITFTFPIGEKTSFTNGLEILRTTDLRNSLIKIKQPHLRIYGALDSLIPIEVTYLLNNNWLNSLSLIIKDAAHVPFISHPNKFCQSIINFIHYK